MPSVRKGVLVALLVLLAGCGGTGPTGPTTVVTDSTAAPTTTPTATPSTSMTPTGDTAIVRNTERFTVENATLCPGETGTVTVDALNVTRLQVVGWRGWETIDIDWTDIALSPEPDRIQQSLPPYYVWDAAQPRVTATLPVAVTSNTTPGSYDTTVKAWGSSYEGEVTTTAVVIVGNETACA